MKQITEIFKKYWWVLLIIVVLIVLISKLSRNTTSPSTAYDIDAIQKQIESSPELKDSVKSARNNFSSGSYSLDTKVSYVNWEYDGKKGKIPVSKGYLKVLPSGRIESFRAEADLNALTSESGDVTAIKKALGISGSSPATMQALTALPNTTDNAFTVSFIIEALKKNTSVAVGMTIDKKEGEISVGGEINLDPKTNGYPEAKSGLKLTPHYIFN